MAQVNNMATTIRTLKKNGLWIAGLDKRAKTSIFNSDLAGPLAFVIGGEEKGIRPLVKKQCDLLLSIPQKGPLGTLNASVAGAVSMYEAFRQRNLNLK
jgi:23S rRNA (guanosine2251-2'-O)-methyltransferase